MDDSQDPEVGVVSRDPFERERVDHPLIFPFKELKHHRVVPVGIEQQMKAGSPALLLIQTLVVV
jgi:hypothetical protein